MRVLITGGGGQLGTSLSELCEYKNIEYYSFPSKTLDIRDKDSVNRLITILRPTVVINTAAYTNVDGCETNKDYAWQVNVEGTKIVAEACKNKCTFVQISSDYIFDGKGSDPIQETDIPNPVNVYGETKLQAEKAVQNINGDHLIIRSQWLYGRGNNFVTAITNQYNQYKRVKVVTDQIGRPTSTDELAFGILMAIEKNTRGILHLACKGTASWFDFACRIIKNVEPVPTTEMPRPAQRPAYSVLSLDKAQSLGIELASWQLALQEYLRRNIF